MRAAMIQMDMELGNPELNFARAEQLVRQTAHLNPDVITLPETWNVGFFPRENLKELADRDAKRTKEVFSRLAKELNVNIIAGSVANLREDGGIYNTACVLTGEGNWPRSTTRYICSACPGAASISSTAAAPVTLSWTVCPAAW